MNLSLVMIYIHLGACHLWGRPNSQVCAKHTPQRAQFMCQQPRQSVQLLPKDVEQKRSYGDCCEIHRGVLSNDQFRGGMLINIILIWRHFPWMLPLVSEKLWDTKR